MSTQALLLEERTVLPLVPLRDVVMYPKMVIPLFVGRTKSIRALEIAMNSAKRVLLLTQKDTATELEKSGKKPAATSDTLAEDKSDELAMSDMFDVGCVGNILQMLKLPDGTVKVLIEGLQRAKVHDIRLMEDAIFAAEVTPHIPAESIDG